MIAIENARLFEEVQARTRELQELLEYQTATSEVLSVISRSPNELQPVFDTIAKSAARLLDVPDADIMRIEGEVLRSVAKHGPSQQWALGSERRINRDWVTGRAVVDRTTVQVTDLQAEAEDFPEGAAYAKQFGHRTTLATPLLRRGVPIGAVLIRRMEVRPFTEKQIELVETFADQAVIAIENSRLFEEVQARTRELSRSVDELKALGEVGQAVSSSLELNVVLPRILEHACALSDTGSGSIYVFDTVRGEFNLAAGHNMSEEMIAAVREHPIRLGESLVGQCGERREAVQFADLTAAPPHPLIAMHIKSGVRGLAGGAASPPGRADRRPRRAPPLVRRVLGCHRRSHADLRQSVGDRRPERPPVQ